MTSTPKVLPGSTYSEKAPKNGGQRALGPAGCGRGAFQERIYTRHRLHATLCCSSKSPVP